MSYPNGYKLDGTIKKKKKKKKKKKPTWFWTSSDSSKFEWVFKLAPPPDNLDSRISDILSRCQRNRGITKGICSET